MVYLRQGMIIFIFLIVGTSTVLGNTIDSLTYFNKKNELLQKHQNDSTVTSYFEALRALEETGLYDDAHELLIDLFNDTLLTEESFLINEDLQSITQIDSLLNVDSVDSPTGDTINISDLYNSSSEETKTVKKEKKEPSEFRWKFNVAGQYSNMIDDDISVLGTIDFIDSIETLIDTSDTSIVDGSVSGYASFQWVPQKHSFIDYIYPKLSYSYDNLRLKNNYKLHFLNRKLLLEGALLGEYKFNKSYEDSSNSIGSVMRATSSFPLNTEQSKNLSLQIDINGQKYLKERNGYLSYFEGKLKTAFEFMSEDFTNSFDLGLGGQYKDYAIPSDSLLLLGNISEKDYFRLDQWIYGVYSLDKIKFTFEQSFDYTFYTKRDNDSLYKEDTSYSYITMNFDFDTLGNTIDTLYDEYSLESSDADLNYYSMLYNDISFASEVTFSNSWSSKVIVKHIFTGEQYKDIRLYKQNIIDSISDTTITTKKSPEIDTSINFSVYYHTYSISPSLTFSPNYRFSLTPYVTLEAYRRKLNAGNYNDFLLTEVYGKSYNKIEIGLDISYLAKKVTLISDFAYTILKLQEEVDEFSFEKSYHQFDSYLNFSWKFHPKVTYNFSGSYSYQKDKYLKSEEKGIDHTITLNTGITVGF